MRKWLIAGLLVLVSIEAQAANVGGETRGRVAGAPKKFGTYVALGNPYPSLFGLNAAYNVTNNLRASIGYGEVEVTTSIGFNGGSLKSETVTARTYAAGVDYLFRDAGLRPVVGARIGYFDVSGDGRFEINGFDESTALASVNAGADYIAASGFYAGAGLNAAVIGGSGTGFYANFGYFF